MPHNRLQLQGGVIENETPIINVSGIATSNRIRFRPDPQGLSLPEKLGGWGRFFASTITNGVVRALWGWQDTNDNQWIAFGTDNATSAELGVIQCTVSGSTGLTTATGSVQNITPLVISSQNQVEAQSTAGSNIFTIAEGNVNVGTPPRISTAFITNPISVGGVILQGQYSVTGQTGANVSIAALDILGNPLLARYTTASGNLVITGVTFTPGTPNTLTITHATSYTFPVSENVNVFTADNIISGSYIVISSSPTTVVVATTLSSYTFSTTGSIVNFGVVPIFNTVSTSNIVTVVFPDHGQLSGNDFAILNPTLVGGITLQGVYTVQTVANSYTFTINAASPATATSFQYQGAMSVTSGTRSGTSVTLHSTSGVIELPLIFPISYPVYVQGVNPANWNGFYTITAIPTNAITYTDAGATGSYVSGGSYSVLGGMAVNIYARSNVVSDGTDPYPAQFWSLDSWGNDLLAASASSDFVNYADGFSIPFNPIFYWDPTQAFLYAQPLPNGPTVVNGFFVAMPERQVIAWGTSFTGVVDPLLIRWCDINNFTTWVAQTTNQAGSFRLPSGATIVGARQVNQQGLLWTDIELWSMQYIGQQLVYGFNKIGVGCGLIGKYAHGNLGGIAYWMGKTQIWMLSGDGAVAIPFPIWDVLFQDLDLVNADKITCATNAMFQEVTWYYPIKGGTGENSNYIKLNVSGLAVGQPPIWDYGVLDRSAWIDVSVLQQPIGFSPANELIYQHEISPDADGSAMGETFTTGWFALAESDVMPFVDQVYPDMKWGYFGQTQNASVTLTISGTDFPGTSVQTVGPYTVTQATTLISPRIRHRLLNFTVSGTGTGTWWRLGGIRYRYQADGKF